MKAIIVDDERRTRKFFASVIDWSSLGVEAVLEAGDGEEAYALIREERPELLMIDMRMPRKDGVELLQLVRELPYPHKTIVVSGFDDYHYMKKTIEYGGFDYFTKPIDEHEVTARLREAVRELAREKEAAARGEEAAKAYQEQRRLLRDSLMTQWIDRTALHSEIASQLAEEWRPGAGRPFSLCLCRTNEGAGRIERLYGERKDLFDYSLLNAAGELMGFPERGTGFRYLTAPGTVLLALYGGPGDAAALCRELARRVNAVFGIRIEIAIAGGGSFPDDLGPAYARALSVWEGINQLAPEPDQVYERAPEAPSLLSLLEGERGLPDLLSFGRNDGELRRFAARLLADCRESGALTNRQIRWWERELEAFRELQIGAGTVGSYGSLDFRDSIDSINSIDSIHSLASARSNDNAASPGQPEPKSTDERAFVPTSLVYWDDTGAFSWERLADSLESCLARLSAEMAERAGNERPDAADEIRDYLQRHYREPLMIRDVSAQFYLNAEYAARLFKTKFGVSIKDFVTELRLRHARLLLGNPSLRIAEIAEKVGFADEKYFSRVFKKASGMTPQQYRRSAGSPEGEA